MVLYVLLMEPIKVKVVLKYVLTVLGELFAMMVGMIMLQK